MLRSCDLEQALLKDVISTKKDDIMSVLSTEEKLTTREEPKKIKSDSISGVTLKFKLAR